MSLIKEHLKNQGVHHPHFESWFSSRNLVTSTDNLHILETQNSPPYPTLRKAAAMPTRAARQAGTRAAIRPTAMEVARPIIMVGSLI